MAMSEEIVLACLLHDAGQYLCRSDHGYWGAQIFEPYVSERVTFAIRYHQALRFYPDSSVGYEYPENYYMTFGVDYVPMPHVQAAYEYARNHKWYMDVRMVTTNDLYSFDPKVVVEIDEFTDIIGRHFKQPKEGLGNDNTPVTHMWRTMAHPDLPLYARPPPWHRRNRGPRWPRWLRQGMWNAVRKRPAGARLSPR